MKTILPHPHHAYGTAHRILQSVDHPTQISITETTMQPSRLPYVSDPDVSPGTDPPTRTLIERYGGGETGQRGMDIRVPCPPRARPLCGEVTPSAGPSNLSASSVILHVVHESSPGICHSDAISKVDSNSPCSLQISVCTQSD